jgi:DNA-binding response OmpR family regulator
MKAVLEISGFDVDTAASAREGKSKIKLREYQMVITDMRMENDASGRDVIHAARTAPYHPVVALLTSFPEDDWADMGVDKMLVKPLQTADLIRQIEKLLATHAAKLQRLANAAATPAAAAPVKDESPKTAATTVAAKPLKKAPAKKVGARKLPAKPVARKKVATKKRKKR